MKHFFILLIIFPNLVSGQIFNEMQKCDTLIFKVGRNFADSDVRMQITDRKSQERYIFTKGNISITFRKDINIEDIQLQKSIEKPIFKLDENFFQTTDFQNFIEFLIVWKKPVYIIDRVMKNNKLIKRKVFITYTL
ncbi:hypothetical protein E0I61_15590 [Flavobacterium ranwuense]|uniref:Uncharacterized protein n=1 Tax=Flavobacterium ranwuense TaxID=2541725 RepID=A0ABY2DNJ3_9FLAO|nr:hypothetical protein [Flavobacterium ranwuense]TDE27068.1 hypothetical protein E0I61_15590 [Flavobacterium ranwuense]